ncbi:MAG: allophanate hydrolase [Candidatus Brocadia sp.]|nr:MAG: allophanate hydrolase [Candidatus Brocadia sp.]
MAIEIVPLGDLAIRVCFGTAISEEVHREVQQFLRNFEAKALEGVVECVPAYTTVVIYYLPAKISYKQLVENVQTIYLSLKKTPEIEKLVYTIPVYYGGETGPDLSFIASCNQISEQKVIQIHANKEYLIYMMGFMPGFPYLGGLSKKIHAPRLESPRARVAAGSVGIGGEQTGIYPAEVPSGWRIIGVTPIALFHLENDPPALLSTGNYVKFVPIEFEEFRAIKADKNYKVKTSKRSVPNRGSN